MDPVQNNGSACGLSSSCITSRTQFYQPFNESLMSIEFDYADVIREFKESQLIRYRQFPAITILCLYAVVFVTAVIGNVLVVIVILGHPRMRRSPTNYFLLNMAVSDLMVAVICIPVAMTRNAYKGWLLGEIMCRFTPFVQGVAVASGVFTITALSLDRFLAIKYPMLFRRRNPTVFVKASLFVVWMLAALLMLPMGLVKRVTSNIIKLPAENFTIKYCTEAWTSHTTRHAYAILLLVFIYVIPGLVMTSLYVIMGRRLWTSENDVARHSSSINSNSSATSGRRRVAQMSVVVAVVFAACWLPYYTFSTVLDLTKGVDVVHTVPMDGLYFALLLGHANCAINPVLYCFMGRTFRKSMLNLFYACAKCSTVQYQYTQGQSRRINTTTFRSHYEAASQINSEMVVMNGRQDLHRGDHPLVKLTFSADSEAPKRPSSIRSADCGHGTLRKTVVFASRQGINM